MRLRISQDQISQWKDNPTTEELHRLVLSEIELTREAMGNTYHPFEPAKTQEIMANLNGSLDTWEVILDLLGGDWDIFIEDEEDDGESVGD